MLLLCELNWLLSKEVWHTLRLSKGRCLSLSKLGDLVKSWLLSSLKLGSSNWFELCLLRSSPLLSLGRLSERRCSDGLAEIRSCEWLVETRCCDRFECVERGLLEGRSCEGLLWLTNERWLLLGFCEFNPLRCWCVCPERWLVTIEGRYRCLLKIQGRLSSTWLECIVLNRLCSEQILRRVSGVPKRTWFLNLILVKGKSVGWCHCVNLLLSLPKCLLKRLYFRVLRSKWRFKLHYFWI